MRKTFAKKMLVLVSLLAVLLNLAACVNFEPDVTPLKMNSGDHLETLPKTGDSTSSNNKEYQNFIEDKVKEAIGDKGLFECKDHHEWEKRYEKAHQDFLYRGQIPSRNCGIWPDFICNLFNLAGEPTEVTLRKGIWETGTWDGPQYPGKDAFIKNDPEPANFCLFGNAQNPSRPEYASCLREVTVTN